MKRVLLSLALAAAITAPVGAQYGWFQINGGLIARLSSSETAATIRQDGSGAVLDLYAGTTRIFRVAASGVLSTSTGLNSAGYVLTGDGSVLGTQTRSRWRSTADGNWIASNAAQTNEYTITLADWGTTLSAKSISVPSGGVLFLGAAPFGTLEGQIGTDNRICRFELVGTSNATAEERDGGNICSAAKDTAISINVYYDAAGASGAGYYLQNLRGGTRAVRLALMGS